MISVYICILKYIAFEFNKSALLKESLLFEMVYDFYHIDNITCAFSISYMKVFKNYVSTYLLKKKLGLNYYACTIPDP